jgi:hypothetical protein
MDVSIDTDAAVKEQIVKTVGKDLEGSGRGVIKVKSLYLSGGTEEYNETYKLEQPIQIAYESTRSVLSQQTCTFSILATGFHAPLSSC